MTIRLKKWGKRERVSGHAIPRKHPEEDLQKLCVEFVRRCCPEVIAWHTPSENKFSGILRAILPPTTFYKIMGTITNKLKAMGFCEGILDYELHWKPAFSLFIEFKYGDNGLTEAQQATVDRLRELGHNVEVIYTYEDFVEILRFHGVPMRLLK